MRIDPNAFYCLSEVKIERIKKGNSLHQASYPQDGDQSPEQVGNEYQADFSVHLLFAFHQGVIETPLSFDCPKGMFNNFLSSPVEFLIVFDGLFVSLSILNVFIAFNHPAFF